MNHLTLDTHTDRWHVATCTRCLGPINPGDEAYTAHVSKYEPMNPGPEWEAVGDWAAPVQLGGCLCGVCRKALQAFLMGWDDGFERRQNSVSAYLDAGRESR
ncbi:hypothetical protein ACIBL3_00220 [Kribbella sp. NPDC050124]|uniref:hypothetical protein n=1 Tax=Kribbella sp. NPDC050124 TaxID=3364114 RepID=UPI00378A20CE